MELVQVPLRLEMALLPSFGMIMGDQSGPQRFSHQAVPE